MRVLLCLNRDVMSNLALNLLAPSLHAHRYDIVLTERVGKKDAPKAPQIVHWGRLEHALIEQGLFPMLDARNGAFQSFEGFARASEGRRSLSFASINEGEGLAYLRAFAPDVIVSIRFGQIFKAAAIAVPRHGILNLHSGLLPDYRGVLATFWAMLHAEREIGCTLHRVTDGTIDTGAIIGRHAIAPDGQRSLLWNIASLYDGGVTMIAAALERLEQGIAPGTTPQNAASGGYFSYPQAADVARFTAKGLSLHRKVDYAALFARYGLSTHEITALLARYDSFAA